MVVRQEYAAREQILDGIQRLSDAALPLMGCVMNHARGGIHSSYGYGYGYGYGKSYGYGEKKN
jgi:Mrp family chromosome partitioning ATPase